MLELALLGSGLIGAASSIFGGNKQANAIKSAQDAANAQYQQTRADMLAAGDRSQGIYADATGTATRGLEPWRAAGQNALLAVGNASGANGPDGMAQAASAFQATPGYQWQLDQGLRAVDRSAAARGGLLNGRAIKAAETFGQGLAASEFGNYYNRLFALSQGGQAAAGTQGAFDMAGAQGRSNALLGAAQGVGQQGAINSAMNMGAATNTASIYGNTATGVTNALASTGNNLLYAYGRGWLGGGGGSGATGGSMGL